MLAIKSPTYLLPFVIDKDFALGEACKREMTMPTTDGALVFMSKRRYNELCRTIDMLTSQMNMPKFLSSDEVVLAGSGVWPHAYIGVNECSCEDDDEWPRASDC
ncbi:MAG: hypothetical protein V3S97_02790 [Candidatus Bathyarchaeia archaeon]